MHKNMNVFLSGLSINDNIKMETFSLGPAMSHLHFIKAINLTSKYDVPNVCGLLAV